MPLHYRWGMKCPYISTILALAIILPVSVTALTGCDVYQEMQASASAENARAYEQAGQYDKAVREWQKVIRIRPEDSPHKWLDLYSYGNLLMLLKKYQEAAHIYESMIPYVSRVASRDPLDPPELQTFLCIASAYAAMGQTAKAIAYLTQACAITPRAMFDAEQINYFDPIRETPEYQALRQLYLETGKAEAKRIAQKHMSTEIQK